MTDYLSFRLPEHYLEEYKTKPVKWGFEIGGGNSLSELTFIAKYSRKKEDGSKEQWWECCRRSIEGMYSILKDWCKQNRTPWNEFKAQKSAQEAFSMMFDFKWTPPGRGLANMGTEMVHREQNNASLNNCAAISTEKLSAHSAYAATMPFTRLMEMSMHGVGVGFDTRGAGKLTIHEPNTNEVQTFVVPDTREGWAESVGVLLESYFFKNRSAVEMDYSIVRPAGSPLKRFGGHASGPEPLRKLHEGIRKIFAGRDGEKITSRDIVDVMNMIGKAVVAGGARRSALIALGESTDDDYVNLKNWELPENAERTGPDGWAWTSNNSVFAGSDDDLGHLVDKIAINGEPGVIYLDVMQEYGRLADPKNNRDYRANLVNPCAEISLESHEFCCLVELYPANHTTFTEFERSIKHAYMYAKAVTLMPSVWPETNEVITRNRRIGVSMTGIVEFLETRSWGDMKKWMDVGYEKLRALDKSYSEWLGVRESIKVSTVKPAGTTSIIAGTTSGVHWPTTSGYYIRRQRFLKHDPIVEAIVAAGYHVEPDVMDPEQTVVASFPTKGLEVRSEREVSIWEKAHLAAMAQRYWADNMVSVTVSFDANDEKKEIDPLLRSLQGQLKSVSFLPITDSGTTYAQAPFEPIDRDEAIAQQKVAKRFDMKKLYGQGLEAQGEKFCTTDTCMVDFG
jgi:ribonucleoside-triphosphate reductase